MGTFKGIIALDIDGTINVGKQALEKEVAEYLNRLIAEKWKLIFITGRTYSFTMPVLSPLHGSFFLAVQNGAALYQMPDEKSIKRNYLSSEVLIDLDPIFKGEGMGLLVESGKENQDICYYKPIDFNLEELEYIAYRIEITPERWVAVDSFDRQSFTEFASAKFFATEKKAVEIAEKILKKLSLSVFVIRDPFRQGFHLAQINAKNTSKGSILEHFASLHQPGLPIIAAGDDYNDVEMLEKSTIKIVVGNAPNKLKELADILAPPAAEQGIIQGLKEAIWMVLSK